MYVVVAIFFHFTLGSAKLKYKTKKGRKRCFFYHLPDPNMYICYSRTLMNRGGQGVREPDRKGIRGIRQAGVEGAGSGIPNVAG